MRYRPFILALAALLLTVTAGGETPARSIDDLVKHFEKSRRAEAGVSIITITGRPLYSHRSDQAMIPASNMKLLTTAFALETLGESFQFVTPVHAVDNDVAIVGQFDPLLGDPVLAKRDGASIYAELDRWAEKVAEYFPDGKIGELILYCRLRPEQFHPPGWPDRHQARWYGAPVASLNFHDNCYDVTFTKNDEGVIEPQISPTSRFMIVRNRLKPGKRQLWRLVSNESESIITVTGRVRTATGEPISAPVNNPPMLLGRVLADRLARKNVTITRKLHVINGMWEPPTGPPLIETRTPIGLVVARANKRSLNLAAECLLLRAGGGSWPTATATMTQSLCEAFGLDETGLSVHDGSGLSRDNRLTAANMTTLLRGVMSRPWCKAYIESLSRNGVDGTLRRRLKKAPYLGRIVAKTGYIAGSVCLSGYVLDRQRRPAVIFSILINQARSVGSAKTLQDRICATLVDALDNQPTSAAGD
jgi:D-alanyl-D-alanine carboxypeptidase/D-alanyl-D-alanine-endopeptidase (penicillin-binding protein 4)